MFPAKQMNSVLIADSIRRNLVNLVVDRLGFVVLRATWNVDDESVELARKCISSFRLAIDDRIQALHGVHFFFSCITGTSTNKKGAAGNTNQVRPAISYFICFSPSDDCNEKEFFNLVHDAGLHPEVSPIKVRNAREGDFDNNSAAVTLQKQLCAAFKDHNNACIKRMVSDSNKHCLSTACAALNYEDQATVATGLTDAIMKKVYDRGNLCPEPCRAVVVNAKDFSRTLPLAIERLQSDGFSVQLEYRLPTLSKAPPHPTNKAAQGIEKAVRVVEYAMERLDHVLYRGDVYKRPENAKFAYTFYKTVDMYIDELLANPAICSVIVRHRRELKDILGKKHCAIIRQIELDLDLIEVLNNKCFQISARKFIPTPLLPTHRRVLSPRAFQNYNPDISPRPRYFMSSILNSFPEDQVRARFLNKLFQLLLTFSLPQKVRRLVTCGAKDSGKTTWLSVILGIIPQKHLASITKEGKFATSAIKEDTMLVFLEEWTKEHLTSDVAKAVLQGGLMVTAVKSKEQRVLCNKVPFYITTNNVPDFGEEDANVKRRLAIFETRSLPSTEPDIDEWLKNNAMECIAWMAGQINRHRDLIEPNELFYEKEPRLQASLPETRKTTLSRIKEVSLLEKEEEMLVQREPCQMHGHFDEEAMELVSRIGPQTSTGVCHSPLRPPKLTTPPLSPISSSPLELSPCVVGSVDFTSYGRSPSPTPIPPSGQISGLKRAHPDSENDIFEMSTPSDMASARYMEEVYKCLSVDLQYEINGTHYNGFLAKWHRVKGALYKKPDPHFDAWTLISGQQRDCFDEARFRVMYPLVDMEIERVREACNIRKFAGGSFSENGWKYREEDAQEPIE